MSADDNKLSSSTRSSPAPVPSSLPSFSYECKDNNETTTMFNSWQKLSECDDFIGPKRSKHTMVAYSNSLYVFGGDNGKQMLNDLVTYDLNNNSWGRALNNSPPTPRYHHTAVVYQNSMFLFGGYTGDLNSNSNLCNKNDLYEYRFSSGTWTYWNIDVTTAPAPRAAHGAVVYDNKMWIFAGYDGNRRLNDMWKIGLSPANANKSWCQVEQFGEQPPTVCNFPLCVLNNSMYLFSGQSGAKTSNLLFKFDFKSSTWSIVYFNYLLRGLDCTPPERRSGHVMLAHDNHLYIYGGVLGNNFFHDVHAFDLETKTWSVVMATPRINHPIPSGRSFLSGAIQNDHFYIFGGNGDQNTRSNELYSLKLPNQPKSTLQHDFYRILNEQILCDLKFIFSDSTFIKCHCAVVASRSQYCRQLISREIKSKYGDGGKLMLLNLNSDDMIEIKLDFVNIKALQLVIEFLYTDRIVSLEGRGIFFLNSYKGCFLEGCITRLIYIPKVLFILYSNHIPFLNKEYFLKKL
jgi:leucine-zipper-like transcriptional regulator 1